MRKDIEFLNESLEKHVGHFDRKCIQYDSNIKLLNQQVKDINDFDYHEYKESLKQIDSDRIRHDKLISTLQKTLTELKNSILPSYANKASPNKASVNTVNTTNNLTNTVVVEVHPPMTSRINGTPNKSLDHLPNTQAQGENEVDLIPSVIHSHDSNATTFRIPVRMQGTTEELKSSDDDFFTGFTRKRSLRYYLSGIGVKSTRSGIMSYLEKKGVRATYLRIFQQRERARFLSAKLNVSDECASIVETDNFWPPGVLCRKWISNRDWYRRYNENDGEWRKES